MGSYMVLFTMGQRGFRFGKDHHERRALYHWRRWDKACDYWIAALDICLLG
jgi:hypothetical protein